MGKKDKSKKKGKGAEKTAAKTEKKQSQKRKKELAALGEDDIEKIVAQIEQEEKKRLQVVEHVVGPPTKRINFTFVSHPSKDELVLFGGEYFNGQKTLIFNDLFFYKLPRNEWTLMKAPSGPPPRCGHHMITLPANQGQLWLFGGEYASPTQEQFHHYRDLWVFHIGEKRWEKIDVPGGPSSRSGHRMVCVKKQLFVFGGYHDVLRDFKYFNDIYAFDMENYTWKKLETTGTPPAPRSACNMISLPDGRILIYGGYSKIRLKKDVDKGTVHTDMFVLAPDKHCQDGSKWRWMPVKPGGVTVSARCGMTLAVTPGGKGFAFGGVLDVEDDEDLAGTFYNDMFALDLENQCWRTVQVSGKKNKDGKRRRRKEREDAKEDSVERDNDKESSGEDDEEADLEVKESAIVTSTTVEDGVFTMTLGSTASSSQIAPKNESESQQVFVPTPRMNCGLAIKNGTLYLYGGLMEDGDKVITYSDFYSLDIHKLDEWKTIIPDDHAQEWFDSSSSSEDETDSSEEDQDEEPDAGKAGECEDLGEPATSEVMDTCA